MTTQPGSRHWLWVAGPEYYLDAADQDRADLEPAAGFSPASWWTCSPETRAGDTALLYRSRVKKDIVHFLVARSDAEPLDLPGDRFHGRHVCQFEVIEKLRTPVPWGSSSRTAPSARGPRSAPGSSSLPSKSQMAVGAS